MLPGNVRLRVRFRENLKYTEALQRGAGAAAAGAAAEAREGAPEEEGALIVVFLVFSPQMSGFRLERLRKVRKRLDFSVLFEVRRRLYLLV